jgi:hypothetical protein
MAGQPIAANAAETLMSNYAAYMTSLGVDMGEQTESVSFSLSDLVTWLNSIASQTDEIRASLGSYGDNSPDKNRLTVILWPYRAGNRAVNGSNQEIDPYNEGSLKP